MANAQPASAVPNFADRPMVRYAVLTLGAVACILVAVPVIPFLGSERGVPGPTVTDAVRPAAAVVALACAWVAWTAVACVVGRLLNAAVGLFVLGCGVATVAGRCGTVMDAAFDGDALLPIAVETLAWGVMTAAASACVFRVSGPLIDIPARSKGASFASEALNADALRGMVSGLLCVAALWFLVRTGLKGQAIGAAVVGSVAMAFAARRMLGGAQPILLAAAPVLMAGLAQAWTAYTFKAPIDQAVIAHALPGWSMAMPADVAAGALIGLPIGLGWSKPSEDAG
ncbi:MAG: hypothetical protein ACKOEL_05250 [Planctomycetota bacterium]|jgi:hypothetical protein